MKYNAKGEEMPDGTPVEMPLNFRRPPTLQEQIMRAVRTVVSQDAESKGLESFDEANDFDVNDGEADVPPSRFEIMEDEEFRTAERLVLDKASRDMHNRDAAIKQPKGEKDVQSRGVEGDSERVSGSREKRNAVGVERRSAGERGGRVSESGEGDSRGDA